MRSKINIQPLFFLLQVWNEVLPTEPTGAVNFLTGAGGFLQSVLNGYAGLKLRLDGLYIERPQLPEGVQFISTSGIYTHYITAIYLFYVAGHHHFVYFFWTFQIIAISLMSTLWPAYELDDKLQSFTCPFSAWNAGKSTNKVFFLIFYIGIRFYGTKFRLYIERDKHILLTSLAPMPIELVLHLANGTHMRMIEQKSCN